MNPSDKATRLAASSGEASCLACDVMSKSFGGLRVLTDVSFAVPEGQKCGIIGPNGAGKTTLINILSGNLPPSQGRITYFGHDITRTSVHERTQMGIARTYQVTNLFPGLTVWEGLFLAVLGRKWKVPPLRAGARIAEVEGKAEQLLRRVDMWEKRETRIMELSYGEQRMLEILFSMGSSPRLILLDEPTSGVSAAETGLILEMVRELSRECTVVFVEHDMKFVFELAERVIVLSHGQILADGEPDAIRQNEEVQEVYLGGGGKGFGDARP